ncbi:MAG: cobalamin B12-binding domain-containing protein [Bacteroidia bacterium]|nr:cobalamin B12-binding domain-containing protein [Bacteroidia bacterium]
MGKKVLLAKPGLDGHDVGVKVLAHALKQEGFEVVYTGLRKSVEEIVDRAMKEKADVIGLSILSGTHAILCEQMATEMNRKQLKTPWIVGGNIPSGDVPLLENSGASRAFATGTQINTVVGYIKSMLK